MVVPRHSRSIRTSTTERKNDGAPPSHLPRRPARERKIRSCSSCKTGTALPGCTTRTEPTSPPQRSIQEQKAPEASRRLRRDEQAKSSRTRRIARSGNPKGPELVGIARQDGAEMGKRLRPLLYSTTTPPPPPCQRRRGTLPYYLQALDTDRRPLHPPAATRAAGEGGDRRSSPRRSKGSRSLPFRLSQTLFTGEGEGKRTGLRDKRLCL